jgi:hypothetical protein
MDQNLAPEKGSEAKKQAPSNQAQWKPNFKPGQLVGYRTEPRTWGQHTNLNIATEGRADQAAASERQKKKEKEKGKKEKKKAQPPGESITELLLKYQHQDWMLEE